MGVKDRPESRMAFLGTTVAQHKPFKIPPAAKMMKAPIREQKEFIPEQPKVIGPPTVGYPRLPPSYRSIQRSTHCGFFSQEQRVHLNQKLSKDKQTTWENLPKHRPPPVTEVVPSFTTRKRGFAVSHDVQSHLQEVLKANNRAQEGELKRSLSSGAIDNLENAISLYKQWKEYCETEINNESMKPDQAQKRFTQTIKYLMHCIRKLNIAVIRTECPKLYDILYRISSEPLEENLFGAASRNLHEILRDVVEDHAQNFQHSRSLPVLLPDELIETIRKDLDQKRLEESEAIRTKNLHAQLPPVEIVPFHPDLFYDVENIPPQGELPLVEVTALVEQSRPTSKRSREKMDQFNDHPFLENALVHKDLEDFNTALPPKLEFEAEIPSFPYDPEIQARESVSRQRSRDCSPPQSRRLSPRPWHLPEKYRVRPHTQPSWKEMYFMPKRKHSLDDFTTSQSRTSSRGGNGMSRSRSCFEIETVKRPKTMQTRRTYSPDDLNRDHGRQSDMNRSLVPLLKTRPLDKEEVHKDGIKDNELCDKKYHGLQKSSSYSNWNDFIKKQQASQQNLEQEENSFEWPLSSSYEENDPLFQFSQGDWLMEHEDPLQPWQWDLQTNINDMNRTFGSFMHLNRRGGIDPKAKTGMVRRSNGGAPWQNGEKRDQSVKEIISGKMNWSRSSLIKDLHSISSQTQLRKTNSNFHHRSVPNISHHASTASWESELEESELQLALSLFDEEKIMKKKMRDSPIKPLNHRGFGQNINQAFLTLRTQGTTEQITQKLDEIFSRERQKKIYQVKT